MIYCCLIKKSKGNFLEVAFCDVLSEIKRVAYASAGVMLMKRRPFLPSVKSTVPSTRA